MTKDEYINKIVCEYWFSFKNWSGTDWEYSKKQTYLLGMRSAWNVINPENKISKRELVEKATIWTREEAEQWYIDYLSVKDDDGGIEDRWEILDL
jgi:hypothetical protein